MQALESLYIQGCLIMKRKSIYAVTLTCLFWTQLGNALTLSLSPDTQTTVATGTAVIELIASDLGGFLMPSIGAFSVRDSFR